MGKEEGLNAFVENYGKSIDAIVSKAAEKLKGGDGFLAEPFTGIMEGFGLVFKTQTEHAARLIKLENSVKAIENYTGEAMKCAAVVGDYMTNTTAVLKGMAKTLNALDARVKELEGKNEKHD